MLIKANKSGDQIQKSIRGNCLGYTWLLERNGHNSAYTLNTCTLSDKMYMCSDSIDCEVNVISFQLIPWSMLQTPFLTASNLVPRSSLGQAKGFIKKKLKKHW